MKKAVRAVAGLAVAVCMMMTAGNAMADESGPKFKLGVGTYALIIADDSSQVNYKDAEFYGGALVGTACFTKHVALRGAFYAAENDDNSKWDVSGGDLQLLLGTNFYQGFNVFGGIGVFTETWEYDGGSIGGVSLKADKDFSGAQASFGIGYSWSKVSLDYVVNVRDTSDYEDFTKVDHDYAVSGGINLSYIF
ncbi:hypothetical protein [Desulfoluna spongiiphila]|uniref:Outer membrane protein beta-barrel domain-containing protein n=1 Tax=Desulfoluna spongiiphila TaxID=419481 RepID=A0A1G5BPE8_9BACT|nr:hypothetical protein [Desulfoluna spongiiphila]SCX92079.1 hypothetical protein SAMN05216233_102129 [Desulfoluna spongiiphila]VVS93847.1 hypothetical protein DBB_34190 [Desulfoluna spongiiphila]